MRPAGIDPVWQTAGRRNGPRDQSQGGCRSAGGCVPQAIRGVAGMNPRRVEAITQRLLHQFRRDRRTLALLFGAPLVILGLLGYLLRGGGDVPKMAVVNLDGGPLGSIVTSTLESSKTVSAPSMSQADADARLRSGHIAEYVLSPSAFSAHPQHSTP